MRAASAPTGKPGSVLMFHTLVPCDGSAPNITPYPRRIVYLTLCAVSNHILTPTRPDWIAHRNFTPIEPVADDALFNYSACASARNAVRNASTDSIALPQMRAIAGKPVRVALIGAWKFGPMFLNASADMGKLEGAEVIADLDPERARDACRIVGWEAPRTARTRFVASGVRALRRSGGRGHRQGRCNLAPVSPMPARRSPPANTSSWLTSRPTCSPARSWPKRRGPRAPCIRSPMATSRH